MSFQDVVISVCREYDAQNIPTGKENEYHNAYSFFRFLKDYDERFFTEQRELGAVAVFVNPWHSSKHVALFGNERIDQIVDIINTLHG